MDIHQKMYDTMLKECSTDINVDYSLQDSGCMCQSYLMLDSRNINMSNSDLDGGVLSFNISVNTNSILDGITIMTDIDKFLSIRLGRFLFDNPFAGQAHKEWQVDFMHNYSNIRKVLACNQFNIYIDEIGGMSDINSKYTTFLCDIVEESQHEYATPVLNNYSFNVPLNRPSTLTLRFFDAYTNKPIKLYPTEVNDIKGGINGDNTFIFITEKKMFKPGDKIVISKEIMPTQKYSEKPDNYFPAYKDIFNDLLIDVTCVEKINLSPSNSEFCVTGQNKDLEYYKHYTNICIKDIIIPKLYVDNYQKSEKQDDIILLNPNKNIILHNYNEVIICTENNCRHSIKINQDIIFLYFSDCESERKDGFYYVRNIYSELHPNYICTMTKLSMFEEINILPFKFNIIITNNIIRIPVVINGLKINTDSCGY